ncbi:MAG: RluA family pseudouridine synthase [Treponema sp.]|nr:RluA family pseudouridine synthase [Treponema sp.]
MIFGKKRPREKIIEEGKVLKNLEILFENDLCLVLNKPAGLAVQGGERIKNSLDRLLEQEYGRPLNLVHRLDKDTSGLILVAKNREAASLFAGIFAAGKGNGLIKRYLACCTGNPDAEKGSIHSDLESRGKSRASETFFRLLGRGLCAGKPCSLLELEPGTGRMHQIRRHLAMTGTPVLGDDKYGNFSLNRFFRKEAGLRRLLLHASRLIIPPSPAGFAIDVSAPLPPYFEDFLHHCDINRVELIPKPG